LGVVAAFMTNKCSAKAI